MSLMCRYLLSEEMATQVYLCYLGPFLETAYRGDFRGSKHREIFQQVAELEAR